jgi:hypothetical protein
LELKDSNAVRWLREHDARIDLAFTQRLELTAAKYTAPRDHGKRRENIKNRQPLFAPEYWSLKSGVRCLCQSAGKLRFDDFSAIYVT